LGVKTIVKRPCTSVEVIGFTASPLRTPIDTPGSGTPPLVT
jgi:hypothetical protein